MVGGGFIGLEMAENLAHRGLEITIIEATDQLMPPLDPEMAEFVRQRLVNHNARLQLGDPVAGFEKTAEGLKVTTKSGMEFSADFVILAIGVKPETDLAKSAGLEIGSRGGIRVDESMRTSDPHIWAVGDAVEVRDFVTGEWSFLPLAGPASRQGRIAADTICGRDSKFRGIARNRGMRLFWPDHRDDGSNRKEPAPGRGARIFRRSISIPDTMSDTIREQSRFT